MIMKKLNTLFIALVAAGFCVPGNLTAQAQFKVPAGVLSSGATKSANSNLAVLGTVGQSAVSASKNAAFKLSGGFWNVPDHIRFGRPPDSWNFVSNTGGNATIAVPASINPAIGAAPLQTGDAVGVFFIRDNAQVCAGFSIWQTGRNMSITAWADDQQTTVKDGFAEGELIIYKIWDESQQREYGAVATYQSGGPNFAMNGIFALASLTGQTMVTHSIALASGWNMISSFVDPANPDLQTLLASILPNLVIVKNGAGQVFWPEFNINTIGNWKVRDGYQINMKTATTLSISGVQVAPEAASISLSQGWNLIAYLRNSSMSIETALAGIANRLVIVKNNAGQVYWPEFNINTIGSMLPGEGYQINVSQAATLKYPANSASSPGLAPSKALMADGEQEDRQPQHFPAVANTGANAILLVEFPHAADGDEIAVLTSKAVRVGSGVFHQQKAVITIWGDQALTTNVVEGASEGEALSLKLWSRADQTEKVLAVSALTDALSSSALAPSRRVGMRYQTDAVLIAHAEFAVEVPTSFSLAQNYPNPFNPTTLIKYGLPADAAVELAVYNVLGQRVALLVDEKQKAGYHQIVFQATNLSSGMYFYRLQAGEYVQTRKMIVVR
jgi:hypothetical protein